MALFRLTKGARQLLASCIEIGFEGHPEDIEDQDDINAVALILEELQEGETADETTVYITPSFAAAPVSRDLMGRPCDPAIEGTNNTEAY